MSVMSRGVRNAFRNPIRTGSIIAILALSVGLAVVMLLSVEAVDAKVADVEGSVGTTITVTPAGARGFQGGGDPLTDDDVATIEATDHVVAVTASLTARLTTEGSTTAGGPPGGAGVSGTTDLTSPLQGPTGQTAGAAPAGFTPPLTLTGTTDPTSAQVNEVNTFTITDGTAIDGSSSESVALVGEDLAAANDLEVGSTFTAFDQTLTVAGIYDTGNTFQNAGAVVPLATLQSLSGEAGAGQVIVTVDSVDNVEATTAALQSALGEDVADVVSDTTTSSDTVSSLDNIRTIAIYSLVGALVAGSVIILLSMVMIVRERRREIGVLKAIGSSNAKISLQFVTEALTLTVIAAVVGMLLGVVLSNPVLDVLVSSESAETATTAQGFPTRAGQPGAPPGATASADGAGAAPGRPPGFDFGNVGGVTDVGGTLSDLSTTVGLDVLLYGALAAVAIAVVGSAGPSYLIAKLRPAEVMRAE